MKLNASRHLLTALLLLHTAILRAEPPPEVAVDAKLFPPEFIIEHQDGIGLSDTQRDAILKAAQTMQPEFEEMQKNIRSATQDLAAVLGENPVRVEAALAQFDKVLDREREIKRAHLKFVLSLRAQLKPEQIEKLAQLKPKQAAPPGELQRTIQDKAERVQRGVERWQSEGRDPSPIGEIMNKIDPLMRDGKVQEVNALLDEALKLIESPKK
jgi:Spy/CpxP family protein refolding chaperone